MSVATQDHLDLVLEAAGLDRTVHPALFRRIRLPPPPTGASVGARIDRPSAGSAADGLVTLIVKGMVGDTVGADVIPDLLFGPVGQRVDLDQPAVIVVQLDFADVG